MARLPSQSRLTASATSLIIAYVAAAAAYLLSLAGPVRNAEDSTLDWRFLGRGPVGPKAADIVLVTLDAGDSLAYRNPLPRRRLAEVIDQLHQGGAAQIGLDVYLDAPSFDAAGDSLLAGALARAGNVVLVSRLARGGPCGWSEEQPLDYFAAADRGYATFLTGTDGEIVRRGQVALACPDGHLLSLAAVLYSRRHGLDPQAWRQLAPGRTPAGEEAYSGPYSRLIDFSGPPLQYYRAQEREMPGGFASFSSRQVLSMPPPLLQRLFGAKIVLVGSGLPDASDRFRTPFFAATYGSFLKTSGVEIHAHFLRTLLDERPVREAGFWLAALCCLLPALATAWGGMRFRSYWVLPLALGLVLLYSAASFYVFSAWAVAVPLVAPSLSVGLAAVASLAYLASTEGRRRQRARERFGPLVEAGRVEELAAAGELWNEEGVERAVAVVWLRLRAPDGYFNPMPPRQALEFMQRWWQEAAPVVFSGGGMVFRFEQEGLACAFGAPTSQADHGSRALEAAARLYEAFGDLQRRMDLSDAWGCRIGVDSGQALMGEIAGGARPATRVLGRPVERARDLADAGDEAGAFATQAVMQQAGGRIEAEKAGLSGDEPVYRLKTYTAPPRREEHPFWKYRRTAAPRHDSETEEFIAGLDLFDDFSRRELRHVGPLLYPRSYAVGETVFSQGELGSAMYIIRRGGCDIVEGESRRLLQRLEPRDFFGELALLSDLRRSATAVANRPTEMLVLFQSELFDLVEQRPELGVRLIRTFSRVLGERLLRFNERAADKDDA